MTHSLPTSRRAALGLLGLLPPILAHAEDGNPVPIAGLRAIDLAPRAGGPAWRIFLRIPPGAPPAAGWPALFLLDANAVMGTATDALRVQAAWPAGTGIRDAVLVGIGYPTEAAYDSVRRSWDYSPPPGRSYPPHRPDGPPVRTGGALDFLRFIETELKPFLAARVALDPALQAIFGHSFGGLFVLTALFTTPRAFTHWIAMSPSIYWEDHAVLAAERRFAAMPAEQRGTPRLLMAVGEYERHLAPFQRDQPDAAARLARLQATRHFENVRETADRLRPLGVAVTVEEIPHETHMSMLPQAINMAMRFALVH
ncbi:alpha/beta hydrolase [Neoroseomonas lacus]|uniref:Esterase n=1 Tax=Neoroseomonas lacus TaxID=287609 RepID=A0A917NSR6_9PROT|nr:alpha/beta hydrolase-fold protein [Neoroseomonas lacus]GGJ21447.1 esterase [Neoroseomonas lacus]